MPCPNHEEIGMHTDRLLKLAGLLEADAKNEKGVKFDLGWWAAPSDEADTGLVRKDTFASIEEPIPVNCNTSACAMGLAVISGAFEEFGLYAHYIESKDYDGRTPTYTMFPAMPGSRIGFDAAKELFGIISDDANYLFDPEHYSVTKGGLAELDVAKRIRDFTEGTIDYN